MRDMRGSAMKSDEDKADFRQAALVHLDALYGFAMALTHNQTEAEDLTQETYLRAMRAFGQLVPDSNLKSWLFTIMRNVWRNKLRHDRSGPQFVELDSESSPDEAWQFDNGSGDPLTILVRKVEREGIRGAIQQLPQAYREIVVLRDLEGFSYRQIATVLDCPAGTVMSRLSRAREQLRMLLNEPRAAAARK
jgi:RNA polymerase sigma-70 factor, ECF subfamily